MFVSQLVSNERLFPWIQSPLVANSRITLYNCKTEYKEVTFININNKMYSKVTICVCRNVTTRTRRSARLSTRTSARSPTPMASSAPRCPCPTALLSRWLFRELFFYCSSHQILKYCVCFQEKTCKKVPSKKCEKVYYDKCKELPKKVGEKVIKKRCVWPQKRIKDDPSC